MLKKLHDEGVTVPKVHAHTDNAILMQYLGDEKTAAPRLIDIELDDSIKTSVLAQIEESMKLFLDNSIVHADLSAYNILWWMIGRGSSTFPKRQISAAIRTGRNCTTGAHRTSAAASRDNRRLIH